MLSEAENLQPKLLWPLELQWLNKQKQLLMLEEILEMLFYFPKIEGNAPW